MQSKIKTISHKCINCLEEIGDQTQDAVVVSTFFDPCKNEQSLPRGLVLTKSSHSIIEHCFRILKKGGLAFIYGKPSELWLWAETFNSTNDPKAKMIFKYWTALDINKKVRTNYLAPNHQGLLLYVKTALAGNTPFKLNTKEVRIPYTYCRACNQNLKDWGGKKHLMNPKGTCASDVWKDLPRIELKNNTIPESVMNRIVDLVTIQNKSLGVHIVQDDNAVENIKQIPPFLSNTLPGHWDFNQLSDNGIYLGDCVSFLNRVSEIYPDGIFDLAFADPPYNLSKSYSRYNDEVADREYIEWCDAWLYGMYKTLRPGGSLFVLNLPKWAIYHAKLLSQFMEFRHWIVWDALSEPRGKIMPAHYALLYYTKPGAAPKFRYSPKNCKPIKGAVLPPDAPYYCLRQKCIQNRKSLGQDDKVQLSDIWSDIHRIKHKRDRDAHPCQLPDSLMERIIKLTTDSGDFVFDPFGGAGTTAIAAYKLHRRFAVVDIDKKYVDIAKKKISEMEKNRDLFGELILQRKSISRQRGNGSKKQVELYLQSFARRLGRVPNETDIQTDRPDILRTIDALYPDRNSAVKRCKVALVGL
jgi:DNA modification methylase